MASAKQVTSSPKSQEKSDDGSAVERERERRSEFLTARQLAEVLQVSESTIHRLRRAGRIPAIEITDRLIRFNLKDVRHALRPLQQKASAEGPHGEDSDNQLSFEDLIRGFAE